MILRALLLLALAAILIPHEPDLGLGRPGGASALLSAPLSLLAASEAPQKACAQNQAACANALAAADNIQGFAMRRLGELRQEIAADQRARRRAKLVAED